jgi:tetratricopeptide (TPR) repeat protein
MHSRNVKNKSIIFIIVLIITLSALYWKTFNYELIWDSKIYFKQNPLFTEHTPLWAAFKQSFLREPLGTNIIDFYYRPLLTASFMIEHKLWGLQNTSLRITNLIIYILSLIFLYIFLRHQSEKKYLPEVATLLFALFPLNVDNIVWVVGRSDLFVFFWGILTLLFLEFFVKKGKYHFLILSSLFYLLGIFSKEAFLFFLPVLFLYELVKRKKISIPYHLANTTITILFLVLKSGILGIKNLRFVFSSNIIENIKTAIASLGYYFRSMVFPFSYDRFLPLKEIVNLKYLLLGILFILLFAFLLYKSKKDSELIIPLSFIIFFVCGHLLLVYTTLYPFKVYARYMMIPALGLIWIFVKFIGFIEEKIRFSLVFLIILLFIPSMVIHSQSYKNELRFFQRANRSSPENGYILFKIARVFSERENYLAAEMALHKALLSKQRKETAMLIHLHYADIEFRKADFKKVFEWLERIERFADSPDVELAPLMKFQIDYKKALIFICQGNIQSAEKLLKENIEKYRNKKELYNELFNLYIGHNLWEKALAVEKIAKEQFPSLGNLDVSQKKREFDSLSAQEQMGFYIRYRNFAKAREIINTQAPLNLDLKIFLSKLYYLQGKEEEAEKMINGILLEYSDDFKILNTLGNFYLKHLIRVEEALFYFKKSLQINKNQPEVSTLVSHLIENYLNKLKKF